MNCHCGNAAVMTLRVQPRRDREPLCPEIARAQSWPGGIATVGACSNVQHARQVKDAAICVLSVTPIGGTVVEIKLKDEKEPA